MAEIVRIGLKWLKIAGNYQNCWKWLYLAAQGWKQLEIVRNFCNGWKWMKIAGMAGNG